MANYRSTFANFYTDKGGSYSSVGSIMPVLVNTYTDAKNTPFYSPEYAHKGFLYCDGSLKNIRDYPDLFSIIGNEYLSFEERLRANARQFDSPGEQGTIYRSFINNGDLYFEIYMNDNTLQNGLVVQQRSTPNSATLTFVGGMGSYPTGGILTADVEYVLEYSDNYQNLAGTVGTTVHRLLTDGATQSSQVLWTISMPQLIADSAGDSILPIENYGIIPVYDPVTLFDTNFDQYSGALNDSPAIYWSNISGLPEGVSVSSYELLMENLSLENEILWSITNIPSNVTSIEVNEVPNGTIVTPNIASGINPNTDGTTPWIRENGYAGPQPILGNRNTYRVYITANLSNGQTLRIHRDFQAGSGPLIDNYPGKPSFSDNTIVVGEAGSITDTSFNVEMVSLATHPTIRIRKSFNINDYPYHLGEFRLPDYRDKKLIGFGEGVSGAGTPLVENRASLEVGDVGGKWFISTDVIRNPLEFFSISDVVTTGYNDVQTQIQAYLTGEKQYSVGPMQDYEFTRPPFHQHQLLHSRVNESNEVTLGGVDTFAPAYGNTNGGISDFIPGTSGDGIPLGHSHGLLGSRPLNAVTATYGNTAGIGENSEDPNNPGCFLYGITESPPIPNTSVVSNGTYIQVNFSVDHNLQIGDWVQINNAGTLNGAFQIISDGFTSNTIRMQPSPVPPAATETAAVVKQAAGTFEVVTTIPDPDVWVVNSQTVIGGKETITFPPGLYEVAYDVEIDSAGSLSRTANQAGVNAMKYKIVLNAPGGGGGGTTGNGGNGGNATASFALDGTTYTVTCQGGRSGRSGNGGGAGGDGGTVTISPAITDSRITVSTLSSGPDGADGGLANSSNPAGGKANGGPDAVSGNGGDGGYLNTTATGSFNSSTFTTNGSYNANNDPLKPSVEGLSIYNVRIDASGGGGGAGNSNASNGCTTAGGPASPGRRILGNTTLTSFSFIIGTKGGDGFNDVTANEREEWNDAIGTGAANGGRGGRGAWANGATGGAGGGATGVSSSGTGYILGAGGGGGGGGSGGRGGSNDGCSLGNPGVGPAIALVSQPAIGPYNGTGGGDTGCTGGGGGGGGGGFSEPGLGGGGAAQGGGSGDPHPTTGTTGGGGGGATGASAVNSTYVSDATESTGSSSDGYVQFRVDYSYPIPGKAGGGGGAGGYVVIDIQGDPATDFGTFAMGIQASLGSPGSAGSGGGSGGTNGYVRLVAYTVEATDGTVTSISSPAGRVWETAGWPNTVPSGSGSTTGGAIWHSSSQSVNVFASQVGGFPTGSSLLGTDIQDRYIRFTGEQNRFLQLGPLPLTAATQLYFTVIKGNGSNGGDAPEENLEIFYRSSLDSPTETPIGVIGNGNQPAGYKNYVINLDPDNVARSSNSGYLVLRQTRASTSNDNTDDQADNFGLAGFAIVYGEVETTVFSPSLNASLPGNLGDCGPDSGINVVRRSISAAESNIRFTDGTFRLDASTPISVFAEAVVEDTIPLITRYHRVKYLIKAF